MTKGKKRVVTSYETQTTSTKTFYVSVEGEKTEMQYFTNLNYFVRMELKRKDIKIVPFRSKKGSAPQHVLSSMKERLHESAKENSSDEAWLVIDRNSWSSSQLDELQDWSKEKDSHNFALSNPCFEYWLLLHFESGTGIKSKSKYEMKISQHILVTNMMEALTERNLPWIQYEWLWIMRKWEEFLVQKIADKNREAPQYFN